MKDYYNSFQNLVDTNENFIKSVQVYKDYELTSFNYRLASYSDFLLPNALEARGKTFIKDKEGKEILHESETLAVENRANFIKRFSVPDDIEYGDYILYVKVVYQGETASASSWFSVQKRKITSGQRILIIIASLVIIAMILAEILDLIKRLKIKSEIEKEKRMKKKKEEEVSPDKYIFPNKSRKK